ncbi:MAG: protein kinase domain-containing protein [Aggregatilineales bacterium]
MASGDPLIGRKLGDYSIEAVQGAGGMARVYRGYDEKLDRYAAVKVIEPHLIANEEEGEYRERFLREARAIARLSHQRIVGIYQFGQLDNIYYIAMEYIEGRNLREVLKAYNKQKRTMPVAESLPVLRDIADALDYAHTQDIIHRDIKPSNIIITPDGSRAVLTDFGLALNAIEGTIGNTFGSVHYIAPEQAISSAQAVPQSDQYALGIIAYEMLTGQVPFDDASAMSVALKHISDPPPPIREINPNVSEAVEAVILKALDKDVDHRFEKSILFIEALERAFASVGQTTLSAPPGSSPDILLSWDDEEIRRPDSTEAADNLDLLDDVPTVTDTDSRPSSLIIKAHQAKQSSPDDTIDVPPYVENPARSTSDMEEADTIKPPAQMNALKEKLAAVNIASDPEQEDDKSDKGIPVMLFAGLLLAIVLIAGAVLLLPSLLSENDVSVTETAVVLELTDDAATIVAQALITEEVIPTETESVPTETPDFATSTEVIPTKTPEVATETLEIPTETPESIADTATPVETEEIIPTATPTEIVPTETPDIPAETLEVATETPDIPTETPEMPTETSVSNVNATPVLQVSNGNEAAFLLNYTGEGLMLYNRTEMILSVPLLEFALMRPEPDADPQELRIFRAREWFNGLDRMPLAAEQCMQVTPLEIVDIPPDASPANICERRNFIRSTARAFWLIRSNDDTTIDDAYFEVRLDGEILTTCPVVDFGSQQVVRCIIDVPVEESAE